MASCASRRNARFVGPQRWNVWLERGVLKDFNDYPDTWFSKRVGSTTAPCLPYQQALGQCQIEQLYPPSP